MEDLNELKKKIKAWSSELGFEGMGVSNINIEEDADHLNKWLEKKRHGSMAYMKKHGEKRSRPDLLLPGTIRVISLKIHYYSRDKEQAEIDLDDNETRKLFLILDIVDYN